MRCTTCGATIWTDKEGRVAPWCRGCGQDVKGMTRPRYDLHATTRKPDGSADQVRADAGQLTGVPNSAGPTASRECDDDHPEVLEQGDRLARSSFRVALMLFLILLFLWWNMR